MGLGSCSFLKRQVGLQEVNQNRGVWHAAGCGCGGGGASWHAHTTARAPLPKLWNNLPFCEDDWFVDDVVIHDCFEPDEQCPTDTANS